MLILSVWIDELSLLHPCRNGKTNRLHPPCERSSWLQNGNGIQRVSPFSRNAVKYKAEVLSELQHSSNNWPFPNPHLKSKSILDHSATKTLLVVQHYLTHCMTSHNTASSAFRTTTLNICGGSLTCQGRVSSSSATPLLPHALAPALL